MNKDQLLLERAYAKIVRENTFDFQKYDEYWERAEEMPDPRTYKDFKLMVDQLAQQHGGIKAFNMQEPADAAIQQFWQRLAENGYTLKDRYDEAEPILVVFNDDYAVSFDEAPLF